MEDWNFSNFCFERNSLFLSIDGSGECCSYFHELLNNVQVKWAPINSNENVQIQNVNIFRQVNAALH